MKSKVEIIKHQFSWGRPGVLTRSTYQLTKEKWSKPPLSFGSNL